MSNKNKKGSGVRVAHDFDDFIEDREVILTLKDSNILEGEKIVEDVDTLENVELAAAYKAQVDLENKTKKSYDYYAEKYKEEKTLLPQYDEKPRYKQGFILDPEVGEYNPEKDKESENKPPKFEHKGTLVSLETTKNIASEYYTTEEMKKFAKPMMRKPTANMKKKKEDIIALLEESMEEDPNTDHASRKDLAKQREKAELDDVLTKKKKVENYEQAMEKAREHTKRSNFYEEEYDELERAIENQRRKAAALAKKEAPKVEDVVKNLLETGKKVESVIQPEPNKIEILLEKKPKDVDGVEELKTVNTATDFLNTAGAQEDVNEIKIPESKNLSLKDSRQGVTSVVNVALPSEKLLAWTKSNPGVQSVLTRKKEGEPEKKPDEPLTQEEIEELKKEVKFLEDEDMNTSVAAALKVIRERGLANVESQLTIRGRAKDETLDETLKKFGDIGKDIKLEYRDEKGRLMTPKEAFRYQCWMFTGKRPGKKKQAKRLKKEQTARKAMALAPEQTQTMRALERVQQETNLPYAILSNPKNKK